MTRLTRHDKTIVKALSMVALSAVLLTSVGSSSVHAAVATESSVTQEMCDPTYWNNLSGDTNGAVLMDANQINSFNNAALKTSDCHMNDLTAMDASFDSSELKGNLSSSIISEMPTKPIFVNGIQTDTTTYYGAISQLVSATGWDGVIGPKYALAVSQTQIKSIPTTDYIGYN